jgi:rSAM/selenodomain-associated transferase 1
MTGAVACFVKTPGLSPIKTRLAKDIGKERAEEVYLTMVESVEDVLLNIDSEIDVYWAVGEDAGVIKPLWKKFKAIYTGEGCLGERMYNIYSTLLKKHDYVILIGSDSPSITPEHINCAAEIAKDGRFVFGPTFDGGFYLFAGNQQISKDIWTSVEYSQCDTMEKLSSKIEKYGDVLAIEALADIDTIEDLATLDV